MAVTQEFIKQVAEALMALGDALENEEGYPRGAEVIIDEEDISNNLSLPGVLYNDDPAVNDSAQAVAYVQIPWSVMSRVLAGMKDATRQATSAISNVDEVVEAAQTATSAANTAADNADDKASLANTAAANADASRQAIEVNETTRQSNEQTRQSNESGRVTAESGRVTAESGRVTAENSRVSAETARETQASSDHTRAENDHTAIEASLTAAGNVNAELDGMTVTITNREGQETSVNIGFEIYTTYSSVAAMNADAANVLQGKFVMIATVDPTSAENARLYVRNSNPAGSSSPFTFLSDLDQASSSAWAEWLNTMKPQIEAKITQAEADHGIATADHTTASADHTTATSDHGTAESDHSRAVTDHGTATTDHGTSQSDHTRAESDHTRAETDHSTSDSDHTIATGDHSTATSDHGIATTDHTTAMTDHSTAEDDHTIAVADHETAGSDHAQATTDHIASVTATTNAGNMADYAENIADHPTYIADGTASYPGDIGYVYNWDYDSQEYVRGVMVTLNWATMSQAEKDAIAAEMLANIAFDDVPTENSNKAARSSGIYTAIEDAKAGINAKIPSEATQQNQLADKAWVNTQVTTNAPNHISDNGEPFASLEALQQYSGTVTNNDYAFVKSTDTGGNPMLMHYRYNMTQTQWVFEYSFLTGREVATVSECVNIISELI